MPYLPRSFRLRRIIAIFELRSVTDRSRMVPLGVCDSEAQRKAKLWQIFELQKNGDHYYFLPKSLQSTFALPADGKFVYVILADDPGRTYCGIASKVVGGDGRSLGIEGHGSISGEADVLYAGELVLEQGKLVWWNNRSGHYLPHSGFRHVNFIPAVKLLLPEGLFVDFRKQLAEERKLVATRRQFAGSKKQQSHTAPQGRCLIS